MRCLDEETIISRCQCRSVNIVGHSHHAPLQRWRLGLHCAGPGPPLRDLHQYPVRHRRRSPNIVEIRAQRALACQLQGTRRVWTT